jgi:endonuclease IV
MMPLVQIKNNEGLVRDTYSKAILNTDKKALSDYLMKVEISKRQIAEKEEAKMRLQNLEEEMLEIKSLLMEIVQIRNSNDKS